MTEPVKTGYTPLELNPKVAVHGLDSIMDVYTIEKHALDTLYQGGVSMHQNIWIAALFAGLPCLVNAIGICATEGRVNAFWFNAIGAATFLFAAALVFFLAHKEVGACDKVYREILAQKK